MPPPERRTYRRTSAGRATGDSWHHDPDLHRGTVTSTTSKPYVDWGGATHAACVVDGAGAAAHLAVDHDAVGLARLRQRLVRLGESPSPRIAIERLAGVHADMLVEVGFDVVPVVHPDVVKACLPTGTPPGAGATRLCMPGRGRAEPRWPSLPALHASSDTPWGLNAGADARRDWWPSTSRGQPPLGATPDLLTQRLCALREHRLARPAGS